jgi:UDPglucose--hexose-1-phosphate uridylyltransferase
MPEYRTDLVTGRTVIIAEGRAERPQEFSARALPVDVSRCPFCPGHESETPGEVFALRLDRSRADSPGWRIRAVPNKYPAVVTNSGAYGLHEVLIESARHITLTSELSDDELADVFRATIVRMRAMYADPRIEHVLPFKNVGAAAGASLAHLHSQLIGQSIVPPDIRAELDGAARYRAERGTCVWCDLVERERLAAERVVLESPRFLAFCPFASRFAYETWIVPREHACRFEANDEAGLVELARVSRSVVARLESILDDPAYNYVIHSAPRGVRDDGSYHWQLQILPRSTGIAGFELGAGMFINPVSPETAARRLVGGPEA